MTPPLQRGDFVRVKWAEGEMRAMVVLASADGRSLAVMYDGIIAGFVGMAPLIQSEHSDIWTTLTGTTVLVIRD